MLLTLRPHHILCRLGFSGYGYSPEFISEMYRTARVIRSGRVKTIVAKPGFDPICLSCPHRHYECSKEQEGLRGKAAAEFDRRVLRALKLKLGHPYPLPEVDERIAALSVKAFQDICQGCEWQPLGHCLEAFVRLQNRVHALA